MGPGGPVGPAQGYQPDAHIRSARFRKGREGSWLRLEALVSKLEKKGLDSLTDKEAMDLPLLYQAELSSLAVARGTILDRYLVGYLEALSLRAYLAVYGPRDSILGLAGKFFKTGLPRSVRALKYHILIAFVLTFLSTLAAYMAVVIDNGNYDIFISRDLAMGRDFSATREQLAAKIYGGWRGLEEALVHFATFLFRHNTIVAIFCFSFGFLLGIPTVMLIISNGLMMGSIIALHFEKGLGIEFMGWLCIHGVTELAAIVLAGAAGLSLAEKIILPGQGSRLENLGKSGGDAATVMIGVIIMLFVAGILEGCFRQLIDNTVTRLAIALATGAFWLLYFMSGRKDPANPAGGAP
ncbi:MAG: stage II sporulation protein M [Deltaproteobacteria bacterium]|nr:stage II sporulation protein M [Deltaproteobacteria bacterium]